MRLQFHQETEGLREVRSDCHSARMRLQPAADAQPFDRAAKDPPVGAGIADAIYFFLIAARVS